MCSIFRRSRSNSNNTKNVQNWTLAKRLALTIWHHHNVHSRVAFFHSTHNGCGGRNSHPPLDTYRWAILYTHISYISPFFSLFCFWFLFHRVASRRWHSASNCSADMRHCIHISIYPHKNDGPKPENVNGRWRGRARGQPNAITADSVVRELKRKSPGQVFSLNNYI